MKYYRVYVNAGHAYVKEEGYFRYQGGLVERWGKDVWKRVRARSIEHARTVGLRAYKIKPRTDEREGK